MGTVECLDQYGNLKKKCEFTTWPQKNYSQQMTHSERNIAPKTHSQEAPYILSLLFFELSSFVFQD